MGLHYVHSLLGRVRQKALSRKTVSAVSEAPILGVHAFWRHLELRLPGDPGTRTKVERAYLLVKEKYEKNQIVIYNLRGETGCIRAPPLVIPAKAGIQLSSLCDLPKLDSRWPHSTASGITKWGWNGHNPSHPSGCK